MKRGEIWEAELGGKAGKRAVLILTRSGVIPYLNKVVVAEITSQSKGYPTQIAVGKLSNLSRESFVSAESLHSIPKECLRRYRGELPEELAREVHEAIIFALDLLS